MGTPIHPQQPGPGQNMLNQAPDQIKGSDTLHGVLLMYTPSYV